MRIRLLYPFGDYDPGSFVDVDPKLGDHLVSGRFARRATAEEVIPDEPEPLTVGRVKAYAAEHGITTTEAKRRLRQPAPSPSTAPPVGDQPKEVTGGR